MSSPPNNSKNARFNGKINDKIRQNRYLFCAGIFFMIYSFIEISDCVFLLLIIINIAPNIYLNMGIIIPEIQQILKEQPIFFLPFFISFTLMRITSTIGIFKNRSWGFYLGITCLLLTMILTILFIPLGLFEIFFCTLILIFLFIGFFDKKPIIQ